MKMFVSLRALIIAAIMISPGSVAQTDPPGYTPLFSREQIERAGPESRQRMIDTERAHREAWLERNPPQPVVGTGEDPAEPAATPTRSSPPPRSRRPSRIFRWVDDNGQVHFGDRPGGEQAKEVTVRDRTSPPQPPTRARSPRATSGGLTERSDD